MLNCRPANLNSKFSPKCTYCTSVHSPEFHQENYSTRTIVTYNFYIALYGETEEDKRAECAKCTQFHKCPLLLNTGGSLEHACHHSLKLNAAAAAAVQNADFFCMQNYEKGSMQFPGLHKNQFLCTVVQYLSSSPFPYCSSSLCSLKKCQLINCPHGRGEFLPLPHGLGGGDGAHHPRPVPIHHEV